MSVRLPLVGDGRSARAPAASAARGARIRVERRAITVAARDARAEAFARALTEGLLGHGAAVVWVDAGAGRDGASVEQALLLALAAPSTLVVVSHPALAVEVEGALDVWIGPPPRPSAAEPELAAHRSCQLELRVNAERVARLLASELAALQVPATF